MGRWLEQQRGLRTQEKGLGNYCRSAEVAVPPGCVSRGGSSKVVKFWRWVCTNFAGWARGTPNWPSIVSPARLELDFKLIGILEDNIRAGCLLQETDQNDLEHSGRSHRLMILFP